MNNKCPNCPFGGNRESKGAGRLRGKCAKCRALKRTTAEASHMVKTGTSCQSDQPPSDDTNRRVAELAGTSEAAEIADAFLTSIGLDSAASHIDGPRPAEAARISSTSVSASSDEAANSSSELHAVLERFASNLDADADGVIELQPNALLRFVSEV